MTCQGRNREQHCCGLGPRPCPFLEENTEPGFRWSCGLRRELGSWDAVLADDRYQSVVQSHWNSLNPDNPMNCRDFPNADYPCGLCGQGSANG